MSSRVICSTSGCAINTLTKCLSSPLVRDKKHLTLVHYSLGTILKFTFSLTSEVAPILQMVTLRLTEGVLHLHLTTGCLSDSL